MSLAGSYTPSVVSTQRLSPSTPSVESLNAKDSGFDSAGAAPIPPSASPHEVASHTSDTATKLTALTFPFTPPTVTARNSNR